MTLEEVNALSAEAFVALFGGVYEHSPWVAERVVDYRPFSSVARLVEEMEEEVWAASEEETLALLRAHPQLAGRAAMAGELTPDSASEQDSAGLRQCTPEEFAELTRLNDEYQARFGFPFIIAVRGLGRAEILAAMRQRVGNDPRAEYKEALGQVYRIAGLRIERLVSDAPAI